MDSTSSAHARDAVFAEYSEALDRYKKCWEEFNKLKAQLRGDSQNQGFVQDLEIAECEKAVVKQAVMRRNQDWRNLNETEDALNVRRSRNCGCTLLYHGITQRNEL